MAYTATSRMGLDQLLMKSSGRWDVLINNEHRARSAGL
jgi:hypothetical protein